MGVTWDGKKLARVPWAGDIVWPVTYAIGCLAMLFSAWGLGVVLGLITILCYNSKRWLNA